MAPENRSQPSRPCQEGAITLESLQLFERCLGGTRQGSSETSAGPAVSMFKGSERLAAGGGRLAGPGGSLAARGERSATRGGKLATRGGHPASPDGSFAARGERSATSGRESATRGERLATPDGNLATHGERLAAPGERSARVNGGSVGPDGPPAGGKNLSDAARGSFAAVSGRRWNQNPPSRVQSSRGASPSSFPNPGSGGAETRLLDRWGGASCP